MSAAEWKEAWGLELEAAVCVACDRRYLLPAGVPSARCPLCFQGTLASLAAEERYLPYVRPPELVLPFSVSTGVIGERVAEFARSIPFPPEDLTPANLQQRLQQIYLPLWLVDADVAATFQVEVGYNYQVVSHQERFANGQWYTHEVKEGRVRWEPRLGRLQRHYDNIVAPALESESGLAQRLGPYELKRAEGYRPQTLAEAVVYLPDRAPNDAWSDAIPSFRAEALAESEQAAQADAVRDFRWSPAFGEQRWTQLLRPAYATFYLDDERQAHAVLLHGQSGRISGRRRASMKRAQRAALVIGIVATALLLLSILAGVVGLWAVPELLTVAGAGLLIAFLVLLVALWPPFAVWRFNRVNGRAE